MAFAYDEFSVLGRLQTTVAVIVYAECSIEERERNFISFNNRLIFENPSANEYDKSYAEKQFSTFTTRFTIRIPMLSKNIRENFLL